MLRALLALVLLTASAPAADTLRGFSPSASRTERDWEKKFAAIPSPDSMRSMMRHLAARPHHVGTPYDRQNADWILARFKSYGLDAHIERFDVLYPTPKERVVELVAPTHFRATLQEPTVAVDPTSSQHAEQMPTYNVYAKDGDVTAPLVYVNYGIPSDYDELARHGVSVKGAIVIARYGMSWRGIKPKVAAEHGAIGCLIYSDPRDDGYAQGDVFPKGPFRPREGVQRGSVADMPLYPGDPLTPGVGATAEAKRLPLDEVKTLTKIPVLPISYGDAQPLLAALGGPVAPESWRGALPITYRIGPGPARVHVRLTSNWTRKPIYDVIAMIRGSSAPDEWVIRGNHHDAWVNGADDPTAGQVALLEEARAMGELLKQGWRPRRTIVFAAWDGEEPGLLGSTEWAEAHADELQKKAVAYLNSDTNERGYLFVAGSHVLESFINDVARDIEDPETHATVWKRLQAQRIRTEPSRRAELRSRADLHIDALGSGSDYTPFLQHLGIPSLDLGYGGEDNGGIYHSIYDDFYWYTHFADSAFVYGRALSQTAGIAVMRLADAELLPWRFTSLAQTVNQYAKELDSLLTSKQKESAERARELDDSVFALTNDPRHPEVAPPREEVPPKVDWMPLTRAIDSLTHAATRYDSAVAKLDQGGDDAYAHAGVSDANALLLRSEHALTDSRGLPGRPWFVHQLYAPGFYTGYGVKTIPAVREAIEQRRFGEIPDDIARVAAVLNAEAALADSAASALAR